MEFHNINIKDCRGQAYDTTASMSSSDTGVQAHIKKHAPDAEFQGCCLHSLNLAICHSSQIQAVRNMMDSCQPAFLYFHNSPKRQHFLEHIISCLCPSELVRIRSIDCAKQGGLKDTTHLQLY